MADYETNLRGVLFKNNNKRPDKRDCDYQGNCEIDGNQFYLDAWINTPKEGGEKYMSLRFKPKGQKPTAIAKSSIPNDVTPFDDDVPF